MFDVYNRYNGFLISTFKTETEANEWVNNHEYPEDYSIQERKPVKTGKESSWIDNEWKYGARAFN